MIPNDTAPEIEELHRRLWMERSPQERAEFAAYMARNAREVILASLPEGLSDKEIKRRLFYRTYGEHLPEDFFEER